MTQSPGELTLVNGQILGPGNRSESVADAMARHPGKPIVEEAITGRTLGHSDYGRASFGAEFVKISIDPDTMHLQVEQLVGAFAGERIINPMLVRSQLMDARTGHWVNNTLGEALIPTNADVADIDIILIEEDDSRGHPLGVKGMGELGILCTTR